jgi:hypothetical protein
MENELLAMVFTIDKFRSYLVGAKVIVYMDHAALKYLLTKKDAKLSHPIYKNINRAIIYAPGSSRAYIQQNYQDITTHITK